MFLLLTLLACSDKASDTGAAGGGDSITVGAQSLVVTATDSGTLHAAWSCASDGALTVTSAAGDQRDLEPGSSADGCLRTLTVSAPPGSDVTFALTGDGGSASLKKTAPALPDGIYQVGDGLTLSGDWVDDGAFVIGYDFLGEQDEPGWGVGALVVLDADGGHLAHVVSAPESRLSHKSGLLLDGALYHINYSKEFDADSMQGNSVTVLPLSGRHDADEAVELATPQGHHFLDLSAEGELLYLDIERVCDFEGSGDALAHDRLMSLPVSGGASELLYDTLDDWIGELVARNGLQATLADAMGNYTNYDCGGDSQRVRDVGHVNGVDCVGDTCILSAIGSIHTLLLVDRSTGALLHDLATFDADWPDGLGTHHDVQFISDDRVLIFENGIPENGATPVMYELDVDAGTIAEIWAPRRRTDCIQAAAMGWVTGVDGDDLEGTLAAWNPSSGDPGVRVLMSYGTGGVYTLEDGGGDRLGRLTFDLNDGSTSECDVSTRAAVAAGQIQHVSEATLAADFPDWIRLK